jgi:hypothetical protein
MLGFGYDLTIRVSAPFGRRLTYNIRTTFISIAAYSDIHICGLGEPAREGGCWSISEFAHLSISV